MPVHVATNNTVVATKASASRVFEFYGVSSLICTVETETL